MGLKEDIEVKVHRLSRNRGNSDKDFEFIRRAACALKERKYHHALTALKRVEQSPTEIQQSLLDDSWGAVPGKKRYFPEYADRSASWVEMYAGRYCRIGHCDLCSKYIANYPHNYWVAHSDTQLKHRKKFIEIRVFNRRIGVICANHRKNNKKLHLLIQRMNGQRGIESFTRPELVPNYLVRRHGIVSSGRRMTSVGY